MSKLATYVLVNCGRVFEGTLHNLLPPAYTVKAATREDIERCLCFQPSSPSDHSNSQDQTNEGKGNGLSEAREAIAAMLAPNSGATADAKMQGEEAGIRGCAGFMDPDCIIYQVSNDVDIDTTLVRGMRRKCRFRDIPILIATSYRDLPKAKSLIQHGADDVVILPSNPDQLLKKVTSMIEPAGTRMPVITRVINPYISAAVDLLSTMAGLHAEKKDVFLKKNYRLFGDISGIMSLTGKVEGQVVVCFEEKLAREVVGRIMSTKPEALTKDDLRDGIGEVVNIIAGNAKAALAATEYAHQIGLPAVAIGQGHEVSHPGNAPCIVVIFDVGGQPMAVLVCMMVK
jgi:chemotaxis protein CheX